MGWSARKGKVPRDPFLGQTQSEMDEEGGMNLNMAYGGGLYASASYANGAFYDDEQDSFVAGTSPPSSPRENEGSVLGSIFQITSRMD